MTTRTKLWQTLALSVSMGPVSTSSMAMEEESTKKLMKVKLESISHSGLEESQNSVCKDRPFASLKKQPGVMGKIGSYLSPEEGKNLLKAYPELFKGKGGGFIGKQFTKRQQEFAMSFHNNFSKFISKNSKPLNKKRFLNNLYQIYPQDTADILKGFLYFAVGGYVNGIELLKGKVVSISVQQKLNEAAYYGKFGFTSKSGVKYLENRADIGDKHAQEIFNRADSNKEAQLQKKLNNATYYGKFGLEWNASLPWYFEFYHVVQSMAKCPVENPQIVKNNNINIEGD